MSSRFSFSFSIESIDRFCKDIFITYYGFYYHISIDGENKGRIFLSEQEIHRFKVKNNTVGYRELYNTIYLRVLESIKDSYKDKLATIVESLTKETIKPSESLVDEVSVTEEVVTESTKVEDKYSYIKTLANQLI